MFGKGDPRQRIQNSYYTSDSRPKTGNPQRGSKTVSLYHAGRTRDPKQSYLVQNYDPNYVQSYCNAVVVNLVYNNSTYIFFL